MHLCSRMKAGTEGLVHLMHEMFKLKSSEWFVILLLDAKNGFNSVSKEAALWNVMVLWPYCSHFLFNNYQGYSSL